MFLEEKHRRGAPARTSAPLLLNLTGLADTFLALIVRSHQQIDLMELQLTALPAAHLCGRSALLTVANTVATRFQQVPIFDKKKKRKKKKLKRSLNFYWLSFLADHLVCPQQVARPSNCLPYVLSFCRVPQIYQL